MCFLFALPFLCEPWELGGSALGCLIFPIVKHKEAPTLESPGYSLVFTLQKCQVHILYRLRKHRVKRMGISKLKREASQLSD